MDFGEATINQALHDPAGGPRYLYHSSTLKPRDASNSSRRCFLAAGTASATAWKEVERRAWAWDSARSTNFITPNDAYVDTVPEPRLARIGSSKLTAGIDAIQTEIATIRKSPSWFQKKSVLNTVMISEELVRYNGISAEAPWRDCWLPAWRVGTKAVG